MRCKSCSPPCSRSGAKKPIFLKVAPDLGDADPERIVRAAIDHRIDAIIVVEHHRLAPAPQVALRGEAGGLSGAPLKPLALDALRKFRRASGGEIPLIGVGGIASADDAWERIRAGASLVQLYSAMVYEGPGIARADRARALPNGLKREGMANIAEAVGNELARRACAACSKAFPSPAAFRWRRPRNCPRRAPRPFARSARPASSRPPTRGPRRREWRSSGKGGSATDAAIAVMLALNVVEPQNSGSAAAASFHSQRWQDAPAGEHRRARDRTARGGPELVHGPRRQAAAATTDVCRRQERGRSRRAGDDGARPPALRPPALGDAVPAGDPAGARWFHGLGTDAQRARSSTVST